jgi:RHS repeat-associated protein
LQEFVLDELTNIAYQKNSDGSDLSILTGQAIDTHLAVVGSSGQVDFGLTDTINSTTATADKNGTISSQFFYEPFGQTTSGSDYPFRFTGRVPVSGNLYHYRARFYNAALARFVSEDPIDLISERSLFEYGSNNPVGFIDPQGTLSAASIGVGVAIVGGISVFLVFDQCMKKCMGNIPKEITDLDLGKIPNPEYNKRFGKCVELCAPFIGLCSKIGTRIFALFGKIIGREVGESITE